MKKLLSFGLILAMSAMLFASQKTIWNYSDEGRYPSDVIIDGIDSAVATVGPKIVAAIDTVSAIAWRPIVTSLEPAIATATGDDSIYYGCIVIPAGMTGKLRAVTLSAAVEYDVADPATVELLILNVTDSDTIVEPFSIDEDSVIYDNVGLALTIYDTTTWDAGDVIQAYVMGDSTLDVICEGCILTFDVDFGE